MDVYRSKRISQVSVYGIKPVAESTDKNTAFSFHETFHKQLKEYYKSRAETLFEEISEQAGSIAEHADLHGLEKYRSLIQELISEVINNAYVIHSELILDYSGKQRIYTTINKIDSDLESLASDLLERNSDRIDFLRRIDEIRGLVMDMLQ